MKSIFLYLLLLFSLSSTGQTIDSMMNRYADSFPQEKIYVQFDKSYYNAGETIWFKAYLMSGIALSSISKNMYFELTDEAGNMLNRKVAPIMESSAFGDFTIPAIYGKQQLHFRAYTTWMLNFDTAFLYEKTVRILSAPAVKAAPTANPTSLRFFPEGGDLVEGTESLLAFKATDRYGKPVKVKGSIFNKSGKKVVDFATVHYGMGTVLFTPEKGDLYTAKWKDATGKEQTTSIPAAKENGIVMHLTPTQDATLFTLKKSKADSGQAKQAILIAHMDQQVIFKAKIHFPASSSEVSRSIPTNELPTGVLQVTLFDEQERPLQERIVFVNNNEYPFDVLLHPIEKKLTKRGKNVIQIELPDTLRANLSIAITDADLNAPDENEDNIYSHFLLSSELRGPIYNPGYYFSSFADSTRLHLDLVMLTNGWRRFKWDDLAQHKVPEIKYKPEDYLTIQGKISGINPAGLAGKQLIILMQPKDTAIKQKMAGPLIAQVTREGTFQLDPTPFFDTVQLHFQFNNDRTLADRVAVHFGNGLYKNPSSVLSFPANSSIVYIPDSIVAKNKQVAEKYITNDHKKVKVLDAVTVKARTKSKQQIMDEKYASGLFSGGDATSFDLTDDVSALGAMSIFTYLQGRVAGLQIQTGGSGTTLQWQGAKPSLFLNEMPVDVTAIENIPVTDIAYVKAFRPPFFGATGGGAGGAIAIYTKKGGDVTSGANFKGLSRTMLPGYSVNKEFYSPDYASPTTPRDEDDLRVTLYWAPFIFLDKKQRKATITFYNNDITKKLHVIIEGVNEAGKLTRIDEIIQ